MKALRKVALVLAFAGSLGISRAADKPLLTGSPAAQRLARMHKVFLGVATGERDDVIQYFYNELSVRLQKDNGYELVDDPKQAEVLMYLDLDQYRAHLSLVDAESRVIVWSFVATTSGIHGAGTQVWESQAPKGARELSEDLKTVAAGGSAPNKDTK